MTRPMNQPQEARPAIARPPATMTRMMAMGVSHARMFVCREVAPVKNGEVCANANSEIASHPASNMRLRPLYADSTDFMVLPPYRICSYHNTVMSQSWRGFRGIFSETQTSEA